MSGKISSRGPTQSQMANLEKHYNAYTGALREKADLQKQLKETREVAQNAREKTIELHQAHAENLVKMDNERFKIAQAQESKAEALAKLEVIAEEKLKIKEVRDGIRASNATVIANAIAALKKTEEGLPKIKGSADLLKQTTALIARAEICKEANENGLTVKGKEGKDVTATVALKELQDDSKKLILDIQALAKANAAAKK